MMFSEEMRSAAYLDLRVTTPDVALYDFYKGGDVRSDLPDDFRHEIERAVQYVIAGILDVRARDVDIESGWYEYDLPCPELGGPQHEDQCGEPTVRRHNPYGRARGVYRDCGYGHTTAVNPITILEVVERERRGSIDRPDAVPVATRDEVKRRSPGTAGAPDG